MSSFSIRSFSNKILSLFVKEDRISKLPDDLLAKIFAEVVPENASVLPLVSKRFEKMTRSEEFYTQLILRQFPFAKDFKIGLIGAKDLYKWLNTLETIEQSSDYGHIFAFNNPFHTFETNKKLSDPDRRKLYSERGNKLEKTREEFVEVLLSKGMFEDVKTIINQTTGVEKADLQTKFVKFMLSKGMIAEAKDIIAQITDGLCKNLAKYELVKVLFSKGMSEEANDIIAQMDDLGKFTVLTKGMIEEAKNDRTQLTDSYWKNRAQSQSEICRIDAFKRND